MSTPNVKIMACKCHNEYQDKHYGTKNRVFNKMAKKEKSKQQWRCTSCATVKEADDN